MHLARSEVSVLFLQQARSLQVTIVDEENGFTYHVEVDGVAYHACVLSTSRDYYEYRLNISSSHITMLIVGGHNTRVPIPCLALDEGYFYAPTEAPRWYMLDDPRTLKNAMVVIGGLLSGVDEAYQQLQDMKRSTRYRYLARMRTYLSLKQGRQLVV